MLHRNHDGFVSFHRKVDGKFEDLFSIPARELDGIFPQLSPLLERDSYFSINGYYRAGHGIARNSPNDLQLQRANRKTESLRWLTACFADLDCHQLGIDVGTAIGRIITAQDDGNIPPASLIIRSGRGVWLFWFLTDERGGLVRAWDEKTRLWCNVQREIGTRLAGLGADANARDATRITRIAGSINSKVESRVTYWTQLNSSGHKYTYTLPGLSQFFNVKLPQRHPRVEHTVDKLKERGQRGQRGRWLKAREQFEQLWELRGTFAEGTRNNAVFIYATILRSQRISDDVVRQEVERLVSHFDQGEEPYTRDDMTAALKSAPGFPRFGGMRNQTIADLLRITPQESAVLETWNAAEVFFPRHTTGEPKLTRPQEATRRQEILKSHIKQIGYVPTVRELSEYLAGIGIDAAPTTVGKDLERAAIRNPRKRTGRPAKRARKNDRKLFE
jgi:hypothetical protein